MIGVSTTSCFIEKYDIFINLMNVVSHIFVCRQQNLLSTFSFWDIPIKGFKARYKVKTVVEAEENHCMCLYIEHAGLFVCLFVCLFFKHLPTYVQRYRRRGRGTKLLSFLSVMRSTTLCLGAMYENKPLFFQGGVMRGTSTSSSQPLRLHSYAELDNHHHHHSQVTNTQALLPTTTTTSTTTSSTS